MAHRLRALTLRLTLLLAALGAAMAPAHAHAMGLAVVLCPHAAAATDVSTHHAAHPVERHHGTAACTPERCACAVTATAVLLPPGPALPGAPALRIEPAAADRPTAVEPDRPDPPPRSRA